jgi:hypothetical protein
LHFPFYEKSNVMNNVTEKLLVSDSGRSFELTAMGKTSRSLK